LKKPKIKTRVKLVQPSSVLYIVRERERIIYEMQLILFSVLLLILKAKAFSLSMSSTGKLVSEYSRIRYASRVMYDGTAFRGWQEQEPSLKIRTVQAMVGKQLSARFNTPIRVTGASRTDLGVHARGQAVHFDLPQPCDDLKFLEFTLNRMLPNDVRVYNIAPVPLGTANQTEHSEPWHATKSAVGKLYVYRFCTNTYVDPIRRRYCTHIYQPTDMDLFEKSLQVFVGTHDFQAFANKVERLTREHEENDSEFNTVKTVNSIKLVKEDDNGYYSIEFNLQSALYRMVGI
jgi:tRNA pseudouridine38-40 synthase